MNGGETGFPYSCTSAPVQVAFDITSNCNLRCVHCFNDSGTEAPLNDLPFEQKLEIAEQIGRMRPINVCLCGGETTCSGCLFELMDKLSPNVGKLSMVTNGYLMTPELAQKLKKHGLGLVQVSLDGAYAWQHDSFRGVDGSFDRAVNAIHCLREAGFTAIDVSLVPNKLNFRTMDAYASLCHALGVHQVRLMPFLPSGRGVSVGRNLMLNDDEYFEFQRTVSRLTHEYEARMLFQWGDPLDHMRRMPRNAKAGMTGYLMEIKTNGDLTLTTYLPVVAGNAVRHSLREYWDAGYVSIWGNPLYTRYTEQIRNIYDLEDFEPQPYTGETIVLDLIDGPKEESGK